MRQGLHFHQVFSAAEITGVKGNTKLEHLGFGTVLGSDAKPLKTRNGDNVSLLELITETLDAAKRKLMKMRRPLLFLILKKKKLQMRLELQH